MSDVNIDAFFERLGFAGSIAPTLETLQQLHALHTAAIPFENLDTLMGVPVRLEQKNLEQKLLYDKRGGFGLEHNLLFMALLQSLDYKVRPLGARVDWHREMIPDRPQDHLVLLVDVGGVNYIADVGFGDVATVAPFRLRAEVEQATPLETFRLMGGDPEWHLEVKRGEDWQLVYRFDLAEKGFDDFLAMNDLLLADPRFADNLLVTRSEKTRRLALRNTKFIIRGPEGTTTDRTLTSVSELRDVLVGPFGIALPTTDKLDPALEAIIARGGAT